MGIPLSSMIARATVALAPFGCAAKSVAAMACRIERGVGRVREGAAERAARKPSTQPAHRRRAMPDLPVGIPHAGDEGPQDRGGLVVGPAGIAIVDGVQRSRSQNMVLGHGQILRRTAR